MKRGNFRAFVLGVLLTALVLGLGIPALASAGTKTAELFYNDIKIRLNGKELLPKDANGNAVEPFIIDGTTYLPVRAVGNALGLNVGWDGETKTVILGNDPEHNQPAAWLGELEPFTGTASEEVVTDQQYGSSSTANNGDTYDRVYKTTDGNGASYLLKGQYKRFTGDYYLSKESKNDKTCRRLQIYADGKLIYTSATLTSGVEPTHFDVDITDCYELRLVSQYKLSDDSWSNIEMNYADRWGYYHSYTYIANAALWTE